MHVASGRRIKYGGLTRRVHDGISVQLRQTGSWYGRTNDESTTRAGSGCKEHGHVKLTIGGSDLLAGIGPVVGPDVHRSEEKLAEDSHAWVIVERNDSRLREAKDPNLQNAVKHLVSGGRIRNPMDSYVTGGVPLKSRKNGRSGCRPTSAEKKKKKKIDMLGNLKCLVVLTSIFTVKVP
ncbi:hypothetical protein GW17_00058579 [Ensete ventricosum]|nr:hypothetical protein GW17_00058579 [Ensete ventricosum]